MRAGTLYGISVGPGDPELISLKGLRRLQQADVVAFPARVGGKPGMAQQIVAPWLAPEQQQLPLHFPYVRASDVLNRAWRAAAERVWQPLQRGQSVAFACEGDVGFYSTFAYLAATLQQHYPQASVEAVPGVCSPLAAAAATGEPLVEGDRCLAVLPALYAPDRLEAALAWADTLVLLKAGSVYPQLWDALQAKQLLARSCAIERVGWPQQRLYCDLRERRQLQLSYFSLLIVWARP
ncbi:MAG: precorrin-2 C(20)-methyltransferase [Cyanobacteria bacterium QS_8_64_29]|nr:MAG: precorrin-2 C(20)-methyltransferase [Cyanobacteria bacterium QS_8_64_29]